MDYVFQGQWSDDLRTRVQSWIDQTGAAWGEKNPGQELTDVIQESLGKAKTMAEVSTAFVALKLRKKKAKKLALDLGKLLQSHHAAAGKAPAATPAPEPEAVKIAAKLQSRPSMKKPSMERFEQTKPAAGDHLMGHRRGHVNANNSHLRRRHELQQDAHHAQDAPQGNDNVNSQLGKRQMDSEEEPAYDGQHHEPERNVRPRQQQQLSSGAATIADQLRLMEQLNGVAIGMGFRNAKEMVEMVFGGEAAPMMPPVAAPVSPPLAAYPPAPYHAPYDGRQGGYHPYLGYVNPSHGYGASTNPGAPKLLAAGSAQLTFVDESMKAKVVLLANAVHAAQRIPNAMDGLSTVLVRDRMTFVNVTGEREKLEVCHYPRQLGRFPSFFDSPKQRDAVGTDLIFRRTRPVDQSRFDDTVAALKEGDHAIWYGHPGIGKSTEANFVLFEFLRNLGDGEDSEWPTKVAHRVDGQLFLYTWNAAEGRVECEMLPGETLGDVEGFSRFWAHQQMLTETKPPVLFLALAEREKDPIVSIPTFIALSSRMVKTTLKTLDKSGSCKYLLVRPHEPEELLLMAKVMFEADPEQLCVRLGCEREWDKVVEVLSDRMGIVGPLVRYVFSKKRAFDEYVKSMDAIATTVGTSHAIARLTKFNIPPALQYFVAPYPLGRGAVDPEKPKNTCAFKFLSDHAASLLANSTMDPEFLIYAAVHGLECTETFPRTVRTAAAGR